MKTNLAISRQMSMKIDAANIQIHLEKKYKCNYDIEFSNKCMSGDR
jgi:hypothetical protein